MNTGAREKAFKLRSLLTRDLARDRGYLGEKVRVGEREIGPHPPARCEIVQLLEKADEGTFRLKPKKGPWRTGGVPLKS